MDGSKFGLEKLKSGGYEYWQFKVEILLMRENLWKHVTEAAPEPPTDTWKDGDMQGHLFRMEELFASLANARQEL